MSSSSEFQSPRGWKFHRPQHAEAFCSHTAVQTWKNSQQGRAFPMLWCIVLMRVPLRLTFAHEYAVGSSILTQVAFITTWLPKWVVLRGGILLGKCTRELPYESLEVKLRPQITTISFPGLRNLRSANSFSVKMSRTLTTCTAQQNAGLSMGIMIWQSFVSLKTGNPWMTYLKAQEDLSVLKPRKSEEGFRE